MIKNDIIKEFEIRKYLEQNGYKEELSVFENVDSFDVHRYNSMLSKYGGLRELGEKCAIPNANSLIGDIWSSQFKMSPSLNENVESNLSNNKRIIQRLVDSENYNEEHEKNKLNDTRAAIATRCYGEVVIGWLEEELEKKQGDKSTSNDGQNDGDGIQGNGNGGQGDGASGYNEQNSGNDVTEQLITEILDVLENDKSKEDELTRRFAIAKTKADDLNDSVEDIFGSSADDSPSAYSETPLKDKLQLADILAKSPKFKRVADWCGRFNLVANKKKKVKERNNISPNGLTMGNDVSLLTSDELLNYFNPVTKQEFLRRFAEGRTMQYDTKGSDTFGKGSILCVVDQSGSMNGNLNEQANAFALALALVARKQKRDYVFIPFSSDIQREHCVHAKKGKLDNAQLVKIATSFMNGGTNFESPLIYAERIISRDMPKADVIFITDGESSLSEDFVEQFNKTKRKNQTQILSIIIGERESDIKLVSDELVFVKDLNDSNAFKAFEI